MTAFSGTEKKDYNFKSKGLYWMTSVLNKSIIKIWSERVTELLKHSSKVWMLIFYWESNCLSSDSESTQLSFNTSLYQLFKVALVVKKVMYLSG